MGLPPLPLTRELVLAVGSSMKSGGYRSAEQYFSQAKQERREHGIQMLIKKVERSVTRGTGTQQLKDAFEVDLGVFGLPRHREPQLVAPTSEGWRSNHHLLLVAVGRHRDGSCHCERVWSQRSTGGALAFFAFTLPIQKNDMTGMCVARAHRC